MTTVSFIALYDYPDCAQQLVGERVGLALAPSLTTFQTNQEWNVKEPTLLFEKRTEQSPIVWHIDLCKGLGNDL